MYVYACGVRVGCTRMYMRARACVCVARACRGTLACTCSTHASWRMCVGPRWFCTRGKFVFSWRVRVGVHSYVHACTSVCICVARVCRGSLACACVHKCVYCACIMRVGAHSYVHTTNNINHRKFCRVLDMRYWCFFLACQMYVFCFMLKIWECEIDWF